MCGMKLLPAAPGTCVHCATAHGEHDPHNFQSIFYAMRFKMLWGRDPTHADCVAHLSESRRLLYRQALRQYDINWTAPPAGDPIREPYVCSAR